VERGGRCYHYCRHYYCGTSAPNCTKLLLLLLLLLLRTNYSPRLSLRYGIIRWKVRPADDSIRGAPRVWSAGADRLTLPRFGALTIYAWYDGGDGDGSQSWEKIYTSTDSCTTRSSKAIVRNWFDPLRAGSGACAGAVIEKERPSHPPHP
jgi:hypothetical protein